MEYSSLFQEFYSKLQGYSGWSHVPEGDWMRVEAEQYISTNPPGFIWKAGVKSPFLHFSGRDKYENGEGHLLIKLFSLIPVVDAKGKEID